MSNGNDFAVSKEVWFESGWVNYVEKNVKKLRILHFNDVYNIEARTTQEPCGGSSRFINALQHLTKEEPTLVLFSGDAFSPSNLSILLKGKQMAEILNLCNVSVACVGNHDFDFGVEELASLIKRCNFPWVLSNVTDAETGQPLAGALTKKIIEFQGIRIGIIGIVEEEWMATLSTIDYSDIKYECYIHAGKRLAQQMKRYDRVDVVIALTHMRLANDEIFVRDVPEIDLTLAGHDHDYEVKQIKDRWLIKSGTDFREFSLVELNVYPNKVTSVKKIEKYIIDSFVEEHFDVKQIVDKYMGDLNKELDVVLGEMKVELEGRFSKIRSQETNLGNFMCDIVLEAVDAECCIMNSGSFRSDTIHPVGVFKVRDLKAIFPYKDQLLVISVTGKQLHEALENGVSQYPRLEGRFPQVGGIQFKFDPTKPGGSRIDPASVKVQNEPLDLKRSYRLATKYYMYQGKDGYTSLKDATVLIETEYVPLLFNVVENHFHSVQKLKENTHARFRSSLVPLFLVNRLIKQLSANPVVFKQQIVKDKHVTFRMAALLICKTLRLQRLALSNKDKKVIKQSQEFKQVISEYERKSLQLAPQLEGRIQLISNEIETKATSETTKAENEVKTSNETTNGETAVVNKVPQPQVENQKETKTEVAPAENQNSQ